jgi:hypothetical protein
MTLSACARDNVVTATGGLGVEHHVGAMHAGTGRLASR